LEPTGLFLFASHVPFRYLARRSEVRRRSLGLGCALCVDGVVSSGKTTQVSAGADSTCDTILRPDREILSFCGVMRVGRTPRSRRQTAIATSHTQMGARKPASQRHSCSALFYFGRRGFCGACDAQVARLFSLAVSRLAFFDGISCRV